MSLVSFKDVCKNFDEKEVLKQVSFDIERGKIIGLLGKNGMGKTTIIKLINGLLTPTSGSVLVNGKEVGIESKKIIAFIFALACFVSVTACEKKVNKKEKPSSSSISDSSSIAETTAAENEENKTDKADSKIDESSINDIEEITTEAPTEAITEEPTEITAEKRFDLQSCIVAKLNSKVPGT